MKLPTSQIEKAASKKDVRYYLNNPWLDVEKKRLIATNGHICAIIPAKIEDGDTTGPITIEALKNARQSKSDSIKANETLVVNGTSYLRESGIKYPDVDRAIPNKAEYPIIISLDAALLLKLAEAINNPSVFGNVVKLHISSNLEAVRVTGNNPGAVGVIMPVHL